MNNQEANKINLRDLLHIICKRKTQVFAFFIITVLTVAVFTFLEDPTYEASTQILIKIGPENFYVPTAPNGARVSPLISLNREEQINTEVEILKSPVLAEQVAKEIGPTIIYKDLEQVAQKDESKLLSETQLQALLIEKAAARLIKNLTFERIEKTNVIEASFRHKDPQMAATALNTFTRQYFNRRLHVHNTSRRSRIFFNEQASLLEDRLTRADLKINKFKKEHNVISPREERTLIIEEAGSLRTALNHTLSQISEAKNRIAQLKKQLRHIPRTISQGVESAQMPYVITALQARLVELELKEKGLLTKYTEQSRLVQNVREEIQIVRNKLKDQEGIQYGKSRTGINETYQRIQEELFNSQADLEGFKARLAVQKSQLAGYQAQLEYLNHIEVELNELQFQANVAREAKKIYLGKVEASRISNAMDVENLSNVTQIQAARRPLKPVSPKVGLNLILSVFLGAFGGIGIAFLMESLDDTLGRPGETEKALGLPVLASIPQFEN